MSVNELCTKVHVCEDFMCASLTSEEVEVGGGDGYSLDTRKLDLTKKMLSFVPSQYVGDTLFFFVTD